MKKYNKKPIILLTGLLVLFSLSIFLIPVAAYNEPKTSQGVDLTIWVTDQQLPGVKNVTDPGGAFWSSPLSTGIDSVTVESTGGNAEIQLTNLQTLMQGGTATSDVIGLDTIWTALFAENGWIIPLDSYLEPNEMDDYASGMVAAGTYKGSLYAYPYFMNLGILFYREDLMDLHFGAGNWAPSDFDTWEELKDVANFILNNGSGQLTTADADLVGYVGQLDAYEGGVVNFFEWCGSNGALDLVTSEGDVNINTAEVEAAMDFIKALVPPQYTGVQGNLTQFYANGTLNPENTGYNNYIIPRYGLVHDEGSSVGKWTAGESIFMRQWTFGYGSSLDAGLDFGVAALPHFAGASGYKTSAVGGAILAIPAVTTGTARQAAVNLTKFLGDAEAQEAELVTVSNFPALKSVYSAPPTGFEWIQNWTGQLDLTLSRPVHPSYPLISDVVADYFSDLLSCQKSVATAIEEMETDVLDILAGGPPLEGIPGYTIGLLILTITGTIGLIIIAKKKHN
ncbi:MAG: extracellular solute-binding protein [Promethearchaeota archaeon]|nr:MAG: extracellular solute-binding protein [Candidatus Lokiarchaeota archaeon]